MKQIKFRPGASINQCYAQIKAEAARCGEVVCGEFNDVTMRSDMSLEEFYNEYNKTLSSLENKPETSDIFNRFAIAYADGIPQFDHNRIYSIDDFAAGMKFWAEIKRENGGFATEECLDEMFANIPFLVYDQRDGEIEVVSNTEWCGDIGKHPYYSHWKPIASPKIKN